MMRERKNSKIILALTVRRSLLFFLLLYANILLAAFHKNKDSLTENSKVQITISEGATIYNRHLIYSGGNNITEVKPLRKSLAKKIFTARKILRKTERPSPILKKETASPVSGHFKKLPLDRSGFLVNKNTATNIVLPVNTYTTYLELLENDFFLANSDFRIRRILLNISEGNQDAQLKQNYTRPPPFLL